MKIINGQPINEAYRYYPHLVTTDDIQDALDALDVALDEVEELTENYQIEKDNGEELEKDLESMMEYKTFFLDLVRRYENRFGKIFDTPPDTLLQWIEEDFDKVENLRIELDELKERRQ